MDDHYQSDLQTYESSFYSISLKNKAFIIKRDELLSQCDREIRGNTIKTLLSFLNLSGHLDQVYETLIKSSEYGIASEDTGPYDERFTELEAHIANLQDRFKDADLTTICTLKNIEDLEISIREYHDTELVPLQRNVETTSVCLENNLVEVKALLERETVKTDALRTQHLELENRIERAKNARDRNKKEARLAGELLHVDIGYYSLMLSMAFQLLFVVAIFLLLGSGTYGRKFFLSSRRRSKTEQEISSLDKEILSQKKAISTHGSQVVNLQEAQRKIYALKQNAEKMRASTEQIQELSHYLQNRIMADRQDTTANYLTAKKISYEVRMMKFKSTQQEMLQLIKALARNLTFSTSCQNLMATATWPEKSKLRNLSWKLEIVLSSVEKKLPVVAKLLQEEFDMDLEHAIREIAGCAIREPIWRISFEWILYFIARSTIAILCFTQYILVRHSRATVLCIGGILALGAIYFQVFLEQVFVITCVYFLWWKLSSLQKLQVIAE